MAITIVVEDGTGLPNANSYIDSAFMQEYDTLNGTTLWCDNVSKQKVALVQSAKFLDLRYQSWYPGVPFSSEQGLLYPRQRGCSPCRTLESSGVPIQLKKAQAELVLMYLRDPASLDLNANSKRDIQSETYSVGGGAVSKSVTYFKPQSASAFSVVDAFVRQLNTNKVKWMVPIVRG